MGAWEPCCSSDICCRHICSQIQTESGLGMPFTGPLPHLLIGCTPCPPESIGECFWSPCHIFPGGQPQQICKHLSHRTLGHAAKMETLF